MKPVSFGALFTSLSLVDGLSSPSELDRRQAPGAIASSAFRRRAYHSSGVLDGWLYIDGGEFSYASGSQTVYQYSSSLLAIDLSQDWTNSTVNIHSNSKTSPALVRGGMWVDESSKLLYTGFAGRTSTFGNAQYQDYGLWSFSPDGQGGGTWKNLNGTADSGFQSQIRPFRSLVASGNGVGYVLGGFAVNETQSDDTNDPIAISGLVSYNFTSNKLTNTSVSGITNGGTIQMGGAHFVPNFGPKGILVTFGGDQVGKVAAGSDALVDASTVQIFDPATGKWYEQTTSGNIPENRKEFCMTGAASDNNTYEIFMYAGWSGSLGAAAIPYDEAFVLTLPGFNWIKADYLAENPRHGLTCEHLGGGQMLSIGGLNTTSNNLPDVTLYEGVFIPQDQFTQGLAIFDLNTMDWKDGYTANQTKYTPSDSVKNYYANNPRTPTFSSNGLAQLMAVENFTAATTNAPNSSSGSSSSGSSGSSGSSSSKSSTNTGAIAGGVVGGVLVLAILAGAAIFLMRRRKRRSQPTNGTTEGTYRDNAPDQTHEMADNSLLGSQAADKKYANPTYSAPKYEMPINERRHELA